MSFPTPRSERFAADLEMQRALEEFNRVRDSQGSEPIRIGVGINTGPVIAGAIGSSRTLQYTVIGDAVNVAARLCGVAKGGEVLVSESTQKLVEATIFTEEREAVRVHGKSNALPIFAAMGTRVDAPNTRSTQSLKTGG